MNAAERVALILGCGDIGSAIAAVLWREGWRVVLCDEPCPAHIRRGMSFTDAWFRGVAELGGARARLLDRGHALVQCLAANESIAATAIPPEQVLRAIEIDLLIDARMNKRDAGAHHRGKAPLTIGTGPGFVAGEHVDTVIETAWGDSLGAVLHAGSARGYDGKPRELGGHGRDRYVYAALGGAFATDRHIGERVRAGEALGSVAGVAYVAPLDGCLRGLSADGAIVQAGKKIIEIDPAGDPAACFGLAPRAARIADGVLAALAAGGSDRAN
jgi:xanthine dehydrogenase accessory factor